MRHMCMLCLHVQMCRQWCVVCIGYIIGCMCHCECIHTRAMMSFPLELKYNVCVPICVLYLYVLGTCTHGSV